LGFWLLLKDTVNCFGSRPLNFGREHPVFCEIFVGMLSVLSALQCHQFFDMNKVKYVSERWSCLGGIRHVYDNSWYNSCGGPANNASIQVSMAVATEMHKTGSSLDIGAFR
jgi:hypothetical protein